MVLEVGVVVVVRGLGVVFIVREVVDVREGHSVAPCAPSSQPWQVEEASAQGQKGRAG